MGSKLKKVQINKRTLKTLKRVKIFCLSMNFLELLLSLFLLLYFICQEKWLTCKFLTCIWQKLWNINDPKDSNYYPIILSKQGVVVLGYVWWFTRRSLKLNFAPPLVSPILVQCWMAPTLLIYLHAITRILIVFGSWSDAVNNSTHKK